MEPTELRETLKELHWSGEHLADRLGIGNSIVRNWLSGRQPVPPAVMRWLRLWRASVGRLPELPDGWPRPTEGPAPSEKRKPRPRQRAQPQPR
jgi:transcriptional regulator with XRE-family HTH domain